MSSSLFAERAIVGNVFRRLRRSAVVVGLAFGATTAASAIAYVDSFPTDADRRVMAASFQDSGAGFEALFGQISRIGTIGGYTAYKSFVFLTAIGAIWAALAVTKLLRGDEEAGRWSLVLAGETSPEPAMVAALAGVAVAIGVVAVETFVLTLLTGLNATITFRVGSALVFAASVTLPALVMAAVAAVCCQLGGTRRLATAMTMGVLGLAFVLRMVGDSGPGLKWVLWTTPFGWAETMHPFTTNELLPLAVGLVVTAALAGAAASMAARRDVGAGLVSTSSSRPLRRAGLGSSLALTARLSAPTLAGWAMGITALSFMFGVISKPVADALADSAASQTMLDRFGAAGTGPVQYLGLVFLMSGAVLALLPASAISSARGEEETGRLATITAARVTRASWLTGRIAVAALAVAAGGVISGLATWAGARSQDVEVRLGDLLEAGVNVIPAALLVLGVGAVALALVPRVASVMTYAVVAWSLLADLIGSLARPFHFLKPVSVFHFNSMAPAEAPDWPALALLTVAAVATSAVALLIFERRDLASG